MVRASCSPRGPDQQGPQLGTDIAVAEPEREIYLQQSPNKKQKRQAELIWPQGHGRNMGRPQVRLIRTIKGC